MENPKKRKWYFYLVLFVAFSVGDFAASMVIDQHTLRYSVISALVSGVIFTGLWWLLEKPQEEDKK